MPSRRVPADLAPNRLAEALAARRAAGLPLLDLTESNPTRAGLRWPAAALRRALRPGAAVADYAPDPRGLPAARAAVAAYYAARGAPIEPEAVHVTAGTSDGYAYLFKLLANPGDEVLFPVPSYPLLPILADLEAVTLVPYPLSWREGAGWRLDLDALAAAVGPRTRAIVAVSPHNPTGAVLSPAERAGLDDLAAARELAVIVDEVFLDYPGPACGAAAAPLPSAVAGAGGRECRALTFALSGLSKVAALPQVKLSWIVAAGPAGPREEAQAALDVIGDAYLAVGAPVQLAAPALLAGAPAAQARVRARVAANEAWLAGRAAGLRAGRLLPRAGGWSAVLELWNAADEEEWCLALLAEDGVAVHPGYFFDFPRRGYAVLSLLTPPRAFRAGAARLLRRLR